MRTRIQMAMQAGVNWVQVREKDMAARELVALVRDAVSAAVAIARATSAGATVAASAGAEHAISRVIVNDRLDVALAAGAAGVHLGRESLNARDVVQWCRSGNAPPEFLTGVSCHSLEEAREAESVGASYIFFGPIFETPSKRALGAPQGLARLAEVCRSVRIPVIAIGGVDEGNALECVRSGAAGIAAIRMFQEARDTNLLKGKVQEIQRYMP
ncbi:MAG: thiamine phosphate synthase [Candidatus Acidiferrales bacterium]